MDAGRGTSHSGAEVRRRCWYEEEEVLCHLVPRTPLESSEPRDPLEPASGTTSVDNDEGGGCGWDAVGLITVPWGGNAEDVEGAEMPVFGKDAELMPELDGVGRERGVVSPPPIPCGRRAF